MEGYRDDQDGTLPSAGARPIYEHQLHINMGTWRYKHDNLFVTTCRQNIVVLTTTNMKTGTLFFLGPLAVFAAPTVLSKLSHPPTHVTIGGQKIVDV